MLVNALLNLYYETTGRVFFLVINIDSHGSIIY